MGDSYDIHGTQSETRRLIIVERLVQAKVTRGLRSLHFWIILGLMVVLTLIYYTVLSDYYDLYVLLFFYPLIYAAIVYRMRGVIVSGGVFLIILLSHSLIISSTIPALVRSLLFAIFAFLISSLCATLLNYLEHQLEAYRTIVSLNKELNDYIQRLKSAERQLIQAEKLNAIGQLAASVAHEINNPLAGVLVYSKLLSKKINGGSISKEEILVNLAKIDAAVSHCSRITHGLLDFSRQSEPTLQAVSVAELMDRVMSLVGHQAEMSKVEVVREEAPSLPPVKADFGQLQQVFTNLAINAIQAMPDGGTLNISSSVDVDRWVKVSMQDNGYGIALENMDKLFTPFFTTKKEGKGVGLGLSVSYGIVERHGGKIQVQSEPGKGTVFTVYLPVYKEYKTLAGQQG